MTTDTTITASALMQKFQAFHELFTEFSHDAAELHENVGLQDETSRAVFTSLSRIMAFTDQMNILVSLMREDVRVIDELTADPVTASWSDQIDRYFYDWLRGSKTAASNIN
jgi:hypothetical protein